MDHRPTIGITMGDPCGVGAELIVRALSRPELREAAKYVIFGFSDQIEYTADQLEIPFAFTREHHENIRRFHHDVVVLDYDEFSLPPRMPRGPSKVGGQASLAFCEDAIAAAMGRTGDQSSDIAAAKMGLGTAGVAPPAAEKVGLIDAIVTSPISKTSWWMAGQKKFPGHTELLKDRTQSRHVAMMFEAPKLRVVLATIHDPIIALRDRLSIGAVYSPIELAAKALREWFGIESPRIGVCGLNPHAGENGNIGDEENRIIAPAILMAQENGIDAQGPFPGDTIFLKALEGQYDCIIAMFHDQGLIPIKLLGWDQAVNVTLGLPIIRTSPDHGTAFDIAGKFIANPGSFIAATNLAIDLAKKGRKP